MSHRKLLFSVSVLAIIVSVGSMVPVLLRMPVAPYAAVLQGGMLFMLVAVVVTTRMASQRAKKQLEATPPSRYSLADRHLLVFHRPLAQRGDELLVGEEHLSAQVDLDAVRFVSWWASSKLPALRDEFIVFWDRDPRIVLTDVQPRATDAAAEELAMVSLVDLAGQPDVRSALTAILDERLASGELETNVDFVTGRMLPDHMPGLAPGVSPRNIRWLIKNR